MESHKVIVLHGFAGQEIHEVIRVIKELPFAKDTAFAATTKTNMTWKLGYLVEHVSQEHGEFKTLTSQYLQEQATKFSNSKEPQ